MTLPHPGWGSGVLFPRAPAPKPQSTQTPGWFLLQKVALRLTMTLGISHAREVHPAVPASQEESPQLSPGLSQTWPQGAEEEVVPVSRNGSGEALQERLCPHPHLREQEAGQKQQLGAAGEARAAPKDVLSLTFPGAAAEDRADDSRLGRRAGTAGTLGGMGVGRRRARIIKGTHTFCRWC